MNSSRPSTDPATLNSDPDGADLRAVTVAPMRADAARLAEFASQALQAVGVPADDADLTARILVDADVHGTETHGIALLYTHYIQLIKGGEVNTTPAIAVHQGSPTTVSVDGDRGLGMLVSERAMRECLRMAHEYGSGWATVFNSTHSAAGAHYVRMAAEQGMIGFHWSTGGSTIAVPGGRGRLLGNNPFSFGAPAGSHPPLVFDMAPSTTIRPKIRQRALRGQGLPPGWTVDADGEPITDPVEFFRKEGAILPLGGTAENGAYKGFGLLLMSDVMTGVLSGDGGSLLRRKGEHSHAFGALRVDAFSTGEDFGETMDAVIDALHDAPAIGDAPVRYPGERAADVARERRENGIPLLNLVADELAEMAAELRLDLDAVWIRG